MKVWRRTTRASHPDALREEITDDKNIFTFEAGMFEKKESSLRPLWGLSNFLVEVPNGCANPKRFKGLESGLDELLKTKGRNKKDVKNASTSG